MRRPTETESLVAALYRRLDDLERAGLTCPLDEERARTFNAYILTRNAADRMVRAARALARSHEIECNTEETPEQTARRERLDARRLARIREDAARWRLDARENGDPRGFAVHLYAEDGTPPMRANGWGDGYHGIG